ncbi:hypothetical protein IAE_11608, partial [Escherichia coli XH140A]
AFFVRRFNRPTDTRGEGGGEKTEVLTIMPADDHPAGIIQAA